MGASKKKSNSKIPPRISAGPRQNIVEASICTFPFPHAQLWIRHGKFKHRVHPFANVFPLMIGGSGLKALGRVGLSVLVEDIKANGLREKITTLDGAILDGRNRWLACRLAGVPPEFEPWKPKRQGDRKSVA